MLLDGFSKLDLLNQRCHAQTYGQNIINNQLYPFMTFEKQFVVCFGPPGHPSGLQLCHFLLIAPLIDRLSGELGPDLAFEFHVS